MPGEPRRDPVADPLLTPQNAAFLLIDYQPADAVGGTPPDAHALALRRFEQAGAHMLSVTQLFCELQRDWQRKETLPAFLPLFVDMGGSAGIAAAEE